MSSAALNLFITALLCWTITGHSQRHLDYFDPDNLQLTRVIWDDDIDRQTEIWLQNFIDSGKYDRIWAIVALGVHLENIQIRLDTPKAGLYHFESLLMGSLKAAKNSRNIDSFLLSAIDTAKLSNLKKHTHTMLFVSDFLLEIALIRQIKKIRQHGLQTADLHHINYIQQLKSDYPSTALDLAGRSKEEILLMLDSYSGPRKQLRLNGYAFSWAFQTYRATFLNDLSKYYLEKNFKRLSDTAQIIVLQYWSFNLDLLNDSEKENLLGLLPSEYTKSEPGGLGYLKIRLRYLIEGRSKEEFMEEISKFGDKKAHAELLKKISENRTPEVKVNVDSTGWKEQAEQASRGVIRPEDRVTIFEHSSWDELLDYIETNLKTELYTVEPFYKNEHVVNLRAATRLLGDMYYSMKNIKVNEARFNAITKTIVDIGIMGYDNSYEEASNLIYKLGKLSIPWLKLEYFSKDDQRAQFAAQKLYELMDRDIVLWMIRSIDNSFDNTVHIRGMAFLRIMRKHRSLSIPNRGISKEESEIITRELIDPYIETFELKEKD